MLIAADPSKPAAFLLTNLSMLAAFRSRSGALMWQSYQIDLNDFAHPVDCQTGSKENFQKTPKIRCPRLRSTTIWRPSPENTVQGASYFLFL